MSTRVRTGAFMVAAVLLASAAAGQRGEVVVAGGLSKPVEFVRDPAVAARWYIVEQTGRVRVVEEGTLRDEPFFEVNRRDFTDRGWEQGLLGMAFDPGYAENRRFYLNYTARDNATHVSRFTATDAHSADSSTEERIIRIEQPYDNHNGGCIAFGPDGMLYIGMGDGGAAHDPHGNAQDLGSLLGKMLRIDVTGEPGEGLSYAVPADNPFVDRDGARPEVWSYGLRNPWKFSWDSRGRMWIADVGQNTREWVSVQPGGSRGGENYGWNSMEGPEPFKTRPRGQNVVPERGSITPPVWSYTHRSNGGNASITGGYFYEGEGVPSLKNRYICADFMSGRIWSFRLREAGRGAVPTADDVVEHTRAFEPVFRDHTARLAISSFGRDSEGELYILDHAAGRVIKIVE